jgi:predicted amidohydrolase
MIIGPGGEVVRETPGGLLLAELTPERLQAARSAFEYAFRFRRPELYASLAKPI